MSYVKLITKYSATRQTMAKHHGLLLTIVEVQAKVMGKEQDSLQQTLTKQVCNCRGRWQAALHVAFVYNIVCSTTSIIVS